MALIECPECGARVSVRASACPQCGHPIAEYPSSDPLTAARAQRWLKSESAHEAERPLPKKANRGCASVFVLLLVFIGVGAIIGDRDDEKEKANPTCKSDWRRCSDNADLVNNFRDISYGQASCKTEAQKLAKFGEPKFPFLAFSTFYKGDNYVKSGIVTLVEKEAQFQNGFGAMVHSTVICKYDLNIKQAVDVKVSSN
ncbi:MULTISPECIES: zinc ribbon domain-containing protein [unclassified Bradyrhizobium]|uniref:zinc ribbon domain-containing protein n=1 Tax=unclassified Bradyrhizobium TaxID=2631580 RepID=UPI0028EDF47C|nr:MULTISPECIES: zinc ribbon domain-containing protein [unclassified Bradyrhizobium]